MSATKILVALCLALGVMFLGGCKKEPENTEQPVKQAPTRREKVEILPEGQPEYSIRRVYDGYDRELERHVTYRDGDIESFLYRENGTQSEYVRKSKTGKIKARMVYATDGKTVVEGKATRSDDTTLWVMDRLPDGSSRKVTYWYDGVKVFSEEVIRKDGTSEKTYYRKSGSVSGKKRTTSAGVIEEFFDTAGNQKSRIDRKGGNTSEVTLYRDGKPYLRQTVVEEPTSWGGVNRTIKQVEELDDNGRITRRITGSSSWNVQSTENFNADGSRIVRTMGSDGYISREETFDAQGKSTGVKDYTQTGDRVRETIDWSLFSRESTPDLEGGWKQQEDYPYYRNWRDE